MTPNVSFDARKSAVLAMDCQSAIVSAYAKPEESFIERATSVLRIARTAAMPVIHVQVGFRPALPEVSSRNKIFAALKSSPEHQTMLRGAPGQIHPALGPEPTDIVVIKRRVSAFAGTDLQMILRAGEIDTLVLFGIATSGVVLSTLLEASDNDYGIAVIADCCADSDADLHTCLMERLFPRRADVITASEFAQAVTRT